jgi:polysaccharide biosynthesis transport protein
MKDQQYGDKTLPEYRSTPAVGDYPRFLSPEVYGEQGYGRGGTHEREDDTDAIFTYLHGILNRKWLVVLVFLVATAIGIFYGRTLPPVYVSSAILEIRKTHPAGANVADLFQLFGQLDLFYNTQIQLLKSQNVVKKYFELVNEAKDDKKDRPKGEPGETDQTPEGQRSYASRINSVLGQVTATPVEGSQLIDISMRAGSAEAAQTMLQTYIRAFLLETETKRKEHTERLRGWLKKELEETEKQLRASQKDLYDFSMQHGIAFADNLPKPGMTYLRKALDELLESRFKRLNLESVDMSKDGVLPQQITGEYLSKMRGELADLQSQYTSMRSVFGEDHYKMDMMKTKIAHLETSITEIEKKALASALDVARKQESRSGEVIEKTKEDALKENTLVVQYEILKKLLDANGQVYVTLLQKYKQADVDHGSLGYDIVIASAPTIPLDPISPNRPRIILIAGVIGLMSGIALALGLEHLDRRVKTAQEVERYLKTPILGVVPRIEDIDLIEEKSGGPESRREFLPYQAPVSPFADALRIVQHAATWIIGHESGMAVCLSSALPFEGKTFMAVSMAAAIASENRRAVIVEADMRRPRIGALFGQSRSSAGLSDLLSGNITDVKEAIRQSHIPGLFYIPCGRIPDNPVSLLKNKRMQNVIDACKKAFDVVIVDMPPLLGLADAAIVSRYTDGVILIVKQGNTPMPLLREAQDAVQRGQGRLLGVVLNSVDHRTDRYYYYSKRYSHYYRRPTSKTDSTSSTG